ncbi:MAG TPA: nucleoside recognition domain-containing protein, partial [Chitinophagales bacterium]|nr:nucleoside recognition domain-containing protein [Chitinophagales bacterium]
PAGARIGIFNTQGVVMMGVYVLGITSALTAALVMKRVIKTSEQSYLVMELPSYKTPHWKNIVLTVWEKVKIFVTQAGKVIMVISIILWFLSSYGPKKKMEAAAQGVAEYYHLPKEQVEKQIAARKMEASFAGHLGKLIEPVIAPLGFDWKIGIAIITSFAAREVFVGTVATLYSVGGSSANETILQKLQAEVNPKTGLLSFRPAVAFSLLIFYVFAMQCMSTMAVVKRETKSWKWPLLQFLYMTGLAYTGSFLVYQVMS